MSNPNSYWALLAILISTAGGVATAWLGGRERRQEVEVPAGAEAPELVGADLQTISGLATALTQQSTRITVLEARDRDTRERMAALWRYVRLLRSTIRGLGSPVPEPDPEDKHLIEQ
ncbi:hypothetical protein [Streptomyces sp. NPDC002386]